MSIVTGRSDMSSLRLMMALSLVLASRLAGAQVAPYGIGRAATDSDVQAKGIAVAPDGTGLPEGHGTVQQGRAIYAARCAGCHGDHGQGIGDYPRLAGGQGTLATARPIQTVGSYWPYATTVWDYIHRAMPYDHPGTLTIDETYAVTAYVLHLNGIVRKNTNLDAKSLPAIRMPNRDGFVGDPRPDIPSRNEESGRARP